MPSLIMLAAIFGPLLVITGIWTLFYRDHAQKVVDSMKKNAAFIYAAGMMNLILGLTIINFSPPIFHFHLGILVVLLGWFLFLRGLATFFLPHLILKLISYRSGFVFFGLISVIWGLAICYLAFI